MRCELVKSGYLALENVCNGQPARTASLNSRTILTGLADQTLQPALVPLVSVSQTENIPCTILEVLMLTTLHTSYVGQLPLE